MNTTPHRPQHRSYRLHQWQVGWQIIAPIVLAALLVIVLVFLLSTAAIRGTGDVSRWAAISTIWLVIPVLIGGLFMLIALIGFAYLIGLLAGFIPPYSLQAQLFAHKALAAARRVEQVGHKPWSMIPEIGRLVKTAASKAWGPVRRRMAGGG